VCVVTPVCHPVKTFDIKYNNVAPPKADPPAGVCIRQCDTSAHPTSSACFLLLKLVHIFRAHLVEVQSSDELRDEIHHSAMCGENLVSTSVSDGQSVLCETAFQSMCSLVDKLLRNTALTIFERCITRAGCRTPSKAQTPQEL
jgi:hypothetical protein